MSPLSPRQLHPDQMLCAAHAAWPYRVILSAFSTAASLRIRLPLYGPQRVTCVCHARHHAYGLRCESASLGAEPWLERASRKLTSSGQPAEALPLPHRLCRQHSALAAPMKRLPMGAEDVKCGCLYKPPSVLRVFAMQGTMDMGFDMSLLARGPNPGWKGPRASSTTLITGPTAGSRRRTHRSLRMLSVSFPAVSLRAPAMKRQAKGAEDLKWCGGVRVVRVPNRHHSSLRSHHRTDRYPANLSVRARQPGAASWGLEPRCRLNACPQPQHLQSHESLQSKAHTFGARNARR